MFAFGWYDVAPQEYKPLSYRRSGSARLQVAIDPIGVITEVSLNGTPAVPTSFRRVLAATGWPYGQIPSSILGDGRALCFEWLSAGDADRTFSYRLNGELVQHNVAAPAASPSHLAQITYAPIWATGSVIGRPVRLALTGAYPSGGFVLAGELLHGSEPVAFFLTCALECRPYRDGSGWRLRFYGSDRLELAVSTAVDTVVEGFVITRHA